MAHAATDSEPTPPLTDTGPGLGLPLGQVFYINHNNGTIIVNVQKAADQDQKLEREKTVDDRDFEECLKVWEEDDDD